VAVVLVVLLAGCSGAPLGDGGSDSGPTATSAAGATDGPVAHPLGYSADGLENASAAYRTHFEAVANTSSYRYEFRRTASDQRVVGSQVRGGAGTLSRFNVTGAAGAAGTPVTVWEPADEPARYRQRVSSGSGETGYGAIVGTGMDTLASPAVRATNLPSEALITVFRVGSFEADGTATRAGTTLRRYRATTAPSDVDGISAVNLTLLVDRDGRVRTATGSYTIDRGEGRTVRVEHRLTGVGTGPGVERPAWVSEAPNVGLQVADGVAVLTNKGEQPLPVDGLRGPGFRKFGAGLDEPVAPGEMVYLFPGESAPEVARSEPTPDTVEGWPNRQSTVLVAVNGTNVVVGVSVDSAHVRDQ
jgi:hypothetical protein